MVYVEPAFLFDIDGCLTLPFSPEDPRSVLDRKLVQHIHSLHREGVPVAFVTGRSTNFFFTEFSSLKIDDIFSIPSYLEFGLVYSVDKEIEIRFEDEAFFHAKKAFYKSFQVEALKRGIVIEDEEHNDYPQSGNGWFERKFVMGSVISNTSVQPDELWFIADVVAPQYSEQLRMLKHALGIDVVPRGWSKKKAAEDFARRVGEGYRWYVFGDSPADKEMAEVLSPVEFISTAPHGHLDVWEKLDALGFVVSSHL